MPGLILLLALAAAAAQPPASEAPGAFVERLYARYGRPGFSPLEHPGDWFASDLTAAIREDSRLAGGEVGYLDGDPVCQCQDHGRIDLRIRSLRRPSAGTAVAQVHVDLGVKASRDLRLSLQRTRAGWRIADIVDGDGRSLLRELKASNRQPKR